MKVSGSTSVCMSVANPNRGTPAPVMHNAAFEALELDYVYVAFEPDQIEQAIGALRALKMAGCSISKPFKNDAIRYVDAVDPIAARIGAINTVVNRSNHLVGYNTDWMGGVAAIRGVVSLEDKRVAVIGAGGAAQAVTFGLLEAKATPTIFNRTLETGRDLAKRFDVEWGGAVEDVSRRDDMQILVNATSVGREVDDRLALDLRRLGSLELVLDVTFNQPTTDLLREAAHLGIATAHGTEMLVEQGAVQFEMFTGQAPPKDVMRAALRSHLYH
jgi:shikimate dehydrogenase